MANESNLIPNNRRSKEEVRKNSAKGGRRSGEVRRRKKLLRECMAELLSMPVVDSKEIKALSKMGYATEDMDNRTALTVALFAKAIAGDVPAFKEIRNLIGEEQMEDKTAGGVIVLPGINNRLGGEKCGEHE